jgi:hypothetical protein|tara:strand:- start:154 stop:408 length:255 start_codon:yes stop_codon:yes gene_type:complete
MITFCRRPEGAVALNRGDLTTVLQFLGIGWYIALCLLAGVGGGVWLDKQLGSLPVLTLLGLGLGLVTAGYGTYKMLKPWIESNR